MSNKTIVVQLDELTDAYTLEYNTQKYTAYIEEIKDLLVSILLENKTLFGHVVSRFLLNKLFDHESMLIQKIPRTFKKEQIAVNKRKLTDTTRFIEGIMTEYEKLLSGTEALIKYKLLVESDVESILSPYFLNRSIEWTSKSLYQKLFDEKKNEVLSYFKYKLRVNPDTYQGELFHFMSTLDRHIDYAKINIIELNEKKIKQEQKLKSEETEENFEDFFAAENELENTIIHRKGIMCLHSELIESHLVLSRYSKDESIPINVFGSANYDAMKLFYQEFKAFLPNTVTQAQIFETFRVNDVAPSNKIELANGSLNDYGHLLNELHALFIQQLKPSHKYNQWWADRFVFSSIGTYRVEKDARAINKFRSAARKGRSNCVSKRSIIASIVAELTKNPQ